MLVAIMRAPILYIALLCTLNAQRQPRIIHQYINGKRGLTHLLERLVEGQRISDIQRQRDELFAKPCRRSKSSPMRRAAPMTR